MQFMSLNRSFTQFVQKWIHFSIEYSKLAEFRFFRKLDFMLELEAKCKFGTDIFSPVLNTELEGVALVSALKPTIAIHLGGCAAHLTHRKP